mgnify:CR=1 FL=1
MFIDFSYSKISLFYFWEKVLIFLYKYNAYLSPKIFASLPTNLARRTFWISYKKSCQIERTCFSFRFFKRFEPSRWIKEDPWGLWRPGFEPKEQILQQVVLLLLIVCPSSPSQPQELHRPPLEAAPDPWIGHGQVLQLSVTSKHQG